jgi:site-specific recombinase XerD
LNNHAYVQSTLNRKLAAVQSYINFLVAEKKLDYAQKHLFHRPKQGQKLPNAISEDEINQLFDSLVSVRSPTQHRDKAIIEVLYGCGLRVSECCQLTLDRVDLKSEILKVTGKRNRQRLTPLGKKALEAITSYLHHERHRHLKKGKCTSLFLTEKGHPISRQIVYNLVKKHVKNAGIRPDISPHSLRHSFATHLMDHNADLLEVKQLLGHVSISSTEIYTHVSQSRLTEIMKKHPRY